MKDILNGVLRDHLGKGSATRLCGVLMILSAIVSGLFHPDAHATTAELVLGGLAALGIRTRLGSTDASQ